MSSHDAERLAEARRRPVAVRAVRQRLSRDHLRPRGDRASAIRASCRWKAIRCRRRCESYFAQSEQIPTLIRTGGRRRRDGRNVAGGLLVQHLPEGEEGRERLHARHRPSRMGACRGARAARSGRTNWSIPSLPLEALVWRLFHEEHEVRVQATVPLARAVAAARSCISRRCWRVSPRTIGAICATSNGIILVDCAFCSREFAIQD